MPTWSHVDSKASTLSKAFLPHSLYTDGFAAMSCHAIKACEIVSGCMLFLPSRGFYSNFRYVKLMLEQKLSKEAFSHALQPEGFSLKCESCIGHMV